MSDELNEKNETERALYAIADDAQLGLFEWINILRTYTTEARLRIALPLLIERNPGRKFKHRELAVIVGASREKTMLALRSLRKKGEYNGELTNSAGGAT